MTFFRSALEWFIHPPLLFITKAGILSWNTSPYFGGIESSSVIRFSNAFSTESIL